MRNIIEKILSKYPTSFYPSHVLSQLAILTMENQISLEQVLMYSRFGQWFPDLEEKSFLNDLHQKPKKMKLEFI